MVGICPIPGMPSNYLSCFLMQRVFFLLFLFFLLLGILKGTNLFNSIPLFQLLPFPERGHIFQMFLYYLLLSLAVHLAKSIQ